MLTVQQKMSSANLSLLLCHTHQFSTSCSRLRVPPLVYPNQNIVLLFRFRLPPPSQPLPPTHSPPSLFLRPYQLWSSRGTPRQLRYRRYRGADLSPLHLQSSLTTIRPCSSIPLHLSWTSLCVCDRDWRQRSGQGGGSGRETWREPQQAYSYEWEAVRGRGHKRQGEIWRIMTSVGQWKNDDKTGRFLNSDDNEVRNKGGCCRPLLVLHGRSRPPRFLTPFGHSGEHMKHEISWDGTLGCFI